MEVRACGDEDTCVVGVCLLQAFDKEKDQSYFLSTVPQVR